MAPSQCWDQRSPGRSHRNRQQPERPRTADLRFRASWRRPCGALQERRARQARQSGGPAVATGI